MATATFTCDTEWDFVLSHFEIVVATLGLAGCCLVAMGFVFGRSRNIHVQIIFAMCFFYGVGTVSKFFAITSSSVDRILL